MTTNHFGTPIGQGTYFSVSRHRVRPTNEHALRLNVSLPGTPRYRTKKLDVNTFVAFKRVVTLNDASQIDISNQGQLYAVCREIQALIHPTIRENEIFVKLQAIIWENGFGAGSDTGSLMWPTLILEHCDTTLAEYQLENPPISPALKTLIGSKVGMRWD